MSAPATSSRPALVAIHQRLALLAERAKVRPLDQVRWCPPQLALLRSRRPFTLLRTGNQFGKTWAGCGEIIHRCLGYHPHKHVRAAPLEAWILCKSWSQSVAIQAKLWHLLPKDLIDPETSFHPVRGFSGVQKAVQFLNGSVIRIKTIGQDTLDLESATIGLVWIDEPLGDAETFSALQMRLRRTGGHVVITMTPATTGDLTWLRELVEQGQVEDLHFRMEAANFIPEGSSRPLLTVDEESSALVPMDQAWIDLQIAKTLPHQRGVRCHGEWEYATVGKTFAAFDRNKHVRDLRGRDAGLIPVGRLEVDVGIDYGEEALRTCAVELYVDTAGAHPRIFAVSEYAPTAGTTVDMDCDGILEMLSANGDQWRDIDHAWADKRYEGRTTKKNAREFERAIARRLALAGELRPAIRVAKKGLKRDHFWSSVKWIHEAMIRPGHFYVDQRCVWLIEALEKWEGGDSEIYKDVLDALRYACRHLWGPRPGAPGRALQRKF